MISLQWFIRSFNELTPVQLYSALALRQRVFVMEQQCLFQDMDGKDHKAMHLFGTTGASGSDIQAYARLFYPGVIYEPASIGRIVTAPEIRGQGVGRVVVERAIQHLSRHTPGVTIRIAAQQHLHAFYASFGFKTVSEPYLDDGIWHIDMILWPD
jgi:ElaA protein